MVLNNVYCMSVSNAWVVVHCSVNILIFFLMLLQRRNLSSPACPDTEERKALADKSLVSILDTADFRADLLHNCPTRSCWIETLSESEEEEDAKNCGSTVAFPFHRSCEDLDLDMIEEN